MKQITLTIIVSIVCSFITVKTLEAFGQNNGQQRRGGVASVGQQGHSHGSGENRPARQRGQGRAGHSHGNNATVEHFAFSAFAFKDIDDLLRLLTPKLALSEQQQQAIRKMLPSSLEAAKQARNNDAQLQKQMLGLNILDDSYLQRLAVLHSQANQAHSKKLNNLIAAREALYSALNATQQAILRNIEVNSQLDRTERSAS